MASQDQPPGRLTFGRGLVPILLSLALTGCGPSLEAEITAYGAFHQQSARDYDADPEWDVFWRVAKQATEIEATRGIMLGIEYRIVSGPPTPMVEQVIVFPEGGITNPDTKETATEKRAAVTGLLGQPALCSFTFENDWELVPGEWVLQIQQRGKTLAEKTITVTR